MGACYSVRGNFVFKENNSSDFCNAIKRLVKQHEEDGSAKFDFSVGNLDDPFNCFQILVNDAYKNDNGVWAADFDASYGWEYVMEDIFSEALRTLECGSFVEIGNWDSDELVYIISLGDGDILTYSKDFEYEDEESDEDDEEENDSNEKYPYSIGDNYYTLKKGD